MYKYATNIFPIREGSKQGKTRNEASSRCPSRLSLLFLVGRICEKAQDNVAQPRPDGSYKSWVREIWTSAIQRRLTYFTRPIKDTLPVSSSPYSVWLTAVRGRGSAKTMSKGRDTHNRSRRQRLACLSTPIFLTELH